MDCPLALAPEKMILTNPVASDIGVTATSPLNEFTEIERTAFLRFVWGRTRLPLNVGLFPQRFKLQSFNLGPPDNYYPVAHTCFFSLELPSYSSLEVMKDKLRYAIFNCWAIDTDETEIGIQAAGLGWEDN